MGLQIEARGPGGMAGWLRSWVGVKDSPENKGDAIMKVRDLLKRLHDDGWY
ncbi:unnamed protein product [marine sediment metagenome]|uniref:Uncharacterized protein n=1 Tax=marine sediment metagenome TaxID=412755 RepID=X0SN79_9ZZZZ